VKVTDSGKHSTLLCYRKNWYCKKFCNIAPWLHVINFDISYLKCQLPIRKK
jgi:hypothetical protein